MKEQVNICHGYCETRLDNQLKRMFILKKFRELDGRKDRSERAIGVYNRKMVIPKSAAL